MTALCVKRIRAGYKRYYRVCVTLSHVTHTHTHTQHRELGVLMDYHEWYLVDWNAFLSLVERIESNLSSTSSPGQPLQGPQKGSNWVPELNHQLLELVKCIQDRLCMHLYVLRVNRDDQKGRGEAGLKEQQQTGHPIADLKGELITLLQ